MRITTWNVNGLRAALRKGFADHLQQISPDVLLLQEIRVLPEQLDEQWRSPSGWHVVWHPAEKKGYSGTAIWSRIPIDVTMTGTSESDADDEGRLVTVSVEGLTGAANIAEGDTYTLTLGEVVEPGDDLVTEYRVDWGDGSPVEIYSSSDIGFLGRVLDHRYGNVAGAQVFNLSVTLVDEDGAHAAAGTTSVTVTNVLPEVELGSSSGVVMPHVPTSDRSVGATLSG